MLADAAQNRSTRESAPSYDDAMRTPTILLPLLLILADGVACKDDEPTGEFGDPCGGDVTTPCGDGLECFIDYCEEKCTNVGDCQPIDGYQRECKFGLCHILCDEMSQECPQTLGTPLECVQFPWCSGAS